MDLSGDRAGAQPLAVGGKELQQAALDGDGQAMPSSTTAAAGSPPVGRPSNRTQSPPGKMHWIKAPSQPAPANGSSRSSTWCRCCRDLSCDRRHRSFSVSCWTLIGMRPARRRSSCTAGSDRLGVNRGSLPNPCCEADGAMPLLRAAAGPHPSPTVPTKSDGAECRLPALAK